MRKTKEQNLKNNQENVRLNYVGAGPVSAQKGITLIALIITIIIMLILVGVTITVAVNGGLFEYAGRAGKETNEAIKNEQLLAEGIINGQTIDDIVGIAVKDDWYGAPAAELPTDKDGNYHIKTCAELAKFASMVNDGNDFAGETVYLDKNLDLQGNKDKQWTPIGVDYNTPFNGIFDGQNHFISGIFIDGNIQYSGLFGDNRGTLKNIGVNDSFIKGYMAGGIVAFSYDGGLIYNCYNTSEVVGTKNTGGIAGYSASNMENCYNSGKVTGISGDCAGGIAGSASRCKINSCCNLSNIIGEGNCNYIAGIVGWDEEGGLTITNCYNLGKIEGNDWCAGITCIQRTIQNCYNAGNIEGKDESYYITSGTSEVENCYFLSENSEDATAKTEEEMKSDAFVTLLNNGGSIWKKDTNNINNGYPILSWQ